MKLSDRDFKLIVLVLLIAIIICPIFFIIRPYNEKIASVEQHIGQLKEREAFLAKLDANRAFYNSSIELLANERTKIIADYAEDLIDENNIFFLAKTEEDINIGLQTLNFSYGEPTTISESSVNPDTGETVEGLTALTSMTTAEYRTEYSNLKDFLKFILDRDKRMVVYSLSAEVDPETNLLKGTFILNQYAVTGEGRSLKSDSAENIPYGVENIFMVPIEEEEAQEQPEE